MSYLRAMKVLLGVVTMLCPVLPGLAGEGSVERGEYLVAVMGCNDCHTPLKLGRRGPRPDMSKMLSGHPQSIDLPSPPALPEDGPWQWLGTDTNTAFAGPWGISYGTNLTPDPATGIGSWTLEIFTKILRKGKHMGEGRPIMPPMPWRACSKLSDDDIAAVFDYLMSIPPIKNRVPEGKARFR